MNKKRTMLHEEKWLNPPKQIIGANFTTGDKLRMLGMIPLVSKQGGDRKALMVFYVSTNNKKTTTKEFVIQYDSTGYSSKVNTDLMVEYDEKDENTLIAETEELTKTMASMMIAKGGMGEFELDTQSPIVITKPPKRGYHFKSRRKRTNNKASTND
jgi:hypothetical protein